jgi:hypothetical protein
MNEYFFTSRLFKGQLIFGYDENGILIKFINEAELSDTQMFFLRSNFPFCDDELPKIAGKSGKIEKIIDLSFDRFWDIYGKKVNRKRCEDLWKRISDGDKQACLSKIKKYQVYCKLNNRILKDPDTYLRNRNWEDEL